MASKLTLAFLVVASLALASCRSAPRVVGGELAEPHEFPYQVSIRWNYGPDPNRAPKHFCGASLLNENYVLTAAHCNNELSPDGFQEVVAGDHNVKVLEGPEQVRRVVSFQIHPGYLNRASPDDVAVVKVDQPFELNSFVQPVQLPKQLEQFEGDVTLTGWGSISTTVWSKDPEALMKVVLPLVDFETCHELWNFDTVLVDTNVCAGPEDGSGAACEGDSGGPLVKNENGTVVQVGIVSWGKIPCGTPKKPTVFAGVANYVDWIEEQMSQDA